MKVGDKLVYKNKNDYMSYYHVNKSYTIIRMCDEDDDVIINDDDNLEKTFYLTGKNLPYYIWNYFYTKEELRQLKLNSI